MKSAGVDGFTAEVASNSSLAFIAALSQAGVDLKVAELPSGYGADLLQAGTGAVQQAQGVYFQLAYEPAGMNTPASRQFVSDLRAVGVAQDPTYAEYNAYASVGLLLKGPEGLWVQCHISVTFDGAVPCTQLGRSGPVGWPHARSEQPDVLCLVERK
jgi:hypothetical protein